MMHYTDTKLLGNNDARGRFRAPILGFHGEKDSLDIKDLINEL